MLLGGSLTTSCHANFAFFPQFKIKLALVVACNEVMPLGFGRSLALE